MPHDITPKKPLVDLDDSTYVDQVSDLETETLATGLLIIFMGGLVRACAVMLALSGRGMKHQEPR